MKNKAMMIPIILLVMGLACFTSSALVNAVDIDTGSADTVCGHGHVCSNDGDSPIIDGGHIKPLFPDFKPNG